MTVIETEARIRRATELLLEARRNRAPLALLAGDARPHTADEACAVQDRTAAALGGRGGWKVGAAHPGAMPGCAPLPRAGIVRAPAVIRAADHHVVGIEGEIAVTFARGLPRRDAPYARAEVLAAIDSVHAAIEIVDSRFVDFRTRTMLEQAADLSNHGGLVLGAPAKVAATLDQTAQRVDLWIDGRLARARIGGNAAGSIQRLLEWLANHCMQRGTPIAEGDVVTTGSCTGLDMVERGADVTVWLPGVGDARVSVV